MRLTRRYTPDNTLIAGLKQVSMYKYLGIYEDPGMTYKYHFEYLIGKLKKINNGFYFLH